MKLYISIEFVKKDGTKGIRSKLEDFETLQTRIYSRIRKIISDETANKCIVPAVNAYNYGEYDVALKFFQEALKVSPISNEEIHPHIKICNRVLAIPISDADSKYLEAQYKYLHSSETDRRLQKEPVFKIRCKYCGKLTAYVDPNEGFAYLNTNNCNVCGRGYPTPDFVWDGVDGQAYIYYRNSVKEDVFYKEFEHKYDVQEDRTYFLKK